MLTATDIDDLLSSRLGDEEALSVLARLTPELANTELFDALISRLQSTASMGFVQALRQFSATSIDCCGTGGSGQARFNTSTAVAFVLAAIGLKVAKFGNRAASGRSGSFDVLGQLGIAASVTPEQAVMLLDKCGVAFLYAPDVYPALARLSPLRQQVGKRTLLNFVGPLLNPAAPAFRLVGTSDVRMHEPMLRAAVRSNGREVLVATGSCGLDDICPSCAPVLSASGERAERLAEAGEMTAPPCNALPCNAAALPDSGTPQANAITMLSIFDGADTDSSAYHLTLSNAAAALVLTGSCDSLAAAREQVAALLSSGAVKRTFLKTVELYETFA